MNFTFSAALVTIFVTSCLAFPAERQINGSRGIPTDRQIVTTPRSGQGVGRPLNPVDGIPAIGRGVIQLVSQIFGMVGNLFESMGKEFKGIGGNGFEGLGSNGFPGFGSNGFQGFGGKGFQGFGGNGFQRV